MVCPKCGGTMKEGLMLGPADIPLFSITWFATNWAEITAQQLLSGDLPPYPKRWMCSAHRCEACGFLEIYATKRQY
jgi:hypothetical protein